MIIPMMQKGFGPAKSSRSRNHAFASVVVVLTLLLGIYAAGAQTIDTVAGNGTMGYNGDGMAATDSALNHPRGVAFDYTGNMYIADASNHRIRRITPAGTISTFAGTGVAGYSGDGGPAASAMLNHPESVAFDAAADLIIADSQNRRIRKVSSSSGIITTIAGTGTEGYSGDGGPATSAMLRRVMDLAIDTFGNIYFVDSVDNRVRRISTAGIITSVAGTGTAGFSGDGGPATSAMLDVPVGLAVDSAGNLYIADARNHVIRKVRKSDGFIFTIAGNGNGAGTDSGSYSGDDGSANQAGLNTPEGIAVDPAGNFYIADMANYRIRRVTASDNVITTIAGTGADGFSGDGGPATQASMNLPWSVALDAFGNVYFGDLMNSRVRKITFASGQTAAPTYYFPHLALGGGWQTTLTYSNYSPRRVTCQTKFYSNSGDELLVPFSEGAVPIRSDMIRPGGSLHIESQADLNTSVISGWAQAQCSGPVKAGIQFRFYQQGVAIAEAGLNAMSAPATKFVTFAETRTEVAYANPSVQPAQVTFTAFSLAGDRLGNAVIPLSPGEHGAAFMGALLGIGNFTGSIQITSTVPIISLSLNGEALPLISSLPPGELDAATPLATGVDLNAALIGSPPLTDSYYFSHLAFGGGWQTTLTYNNYSPQPVACQTEFFSNSGEELPVPFSAGAVSTRMDMLPPGGGLHIESNADLNTSIITGWARTQCSKPVKASLLFRFYQQGRATAEAGVNAMLAPATKFVTFAETRTGVAYVNPSTQPARVVFTAINSAGERLGGTVVALAPGEHRTVYMDTLLNIGAFTGSIRITSAVPIISLSLNGEAFPLISSLPPGELDDATPLATAYPFDRASRWDSRRGGTERDRYRTRDEGSLGSIRQNVREPQSRAAQ